MFGNHHHYVPVLKWKRAEQAALQSIAPADRGKLTPLIEIVDLPLDLDTGDPKKSLEDHVDPALQKLVTVWGITEPFFLEADAVADDTTTGGVSGAQYVFSEAQKLGLQFVPVTGAYRAAADVAAAVAHKARGICIRLVADDITRATLAADLTAFVATHKLTPAIVDVIVDLGAVVGQSALVVAAAVSVAIGTIPTLGAWRTFTVVASAFPEHMGGVPASTSQMIERTEWKAWLALHGRRANLARLPTYGDYLIQHPTGSDGFDPRYMRVSANVRYTVHDEWLILKGVSTKKVRSVVQFQALATQLVKHPSYYGQTHSKGCAEAHACAGGAPNLGSLEVWRRIGTSHHLTVALGQLAAAVYP